MHFSRSWACSAIAAALIVAASGFASPTDDKPPMEVLWAELEKEELEATRALLKMSARPGEAVAFLKTAMKPLKIEPQAAMDLIVKLQSNDETVWRPAFEELEYFDPRLALGLKDLMTDINISPARQRLVEVFGGSKAGSLKDKEIELKWIAEQFIFTSDGGSWGAEPAVAKVGTSDWSGRKKKWTRALRAILLLEHIGTPEALAILERMASGHADAFPTKAARESARMLAKKAR